MNPNREQIAQLIEEATAYLNTGRNTNVWTLLRNRAVDAFDRAGTDHAMGRQEYAEVLALFGRARGLHPA